MIRKLVSIVLPLSLSLMACSAHVDGGSPIPMNFSGGGGGGGSGSASSATVLEGKWTMPCTPLSSNMALSGVTTFKGNTYSAVGSIYSDENCTTLVQQQTNSGTFSIGSTTAAGATEINYVDSKDGAMYDIFKISGTRLYFGSQRGTSAATRPQVLNTSISFLFSN